MNNCSFLCLYTTRPISVLSKKDIKGINKLEDAISNIYADGSAAFMLIGDFNVQTGIMQDAIDCKYDLNDKKLTKNY